MSVKECCGDILSRDYPCAYCPFTRRSENSRLGDHKPFVRSMDNIDPPTEDAVIYEKALLIMEDDQLTAAIFAAGGNMRHINFFSRMHCSCRPVDPWAYDKDRSTADIVTALEATAEHLKKEQSDVEIQNQRQASS